MRIIYASQYIYSSDDNESSIKYPSVGVTSCNISPSLAVDTINAKVYPSSDMNL